MTSPPAGLSRTFASDRRGAVSVLVAVSSVVLIGFAALAVDVGSIFLQSRRLQGVADLAAMAAASDIANAQAAAQGTANSNQAGLTAVASTGSYNPDSSVPVGQRFVLGGTPANAVQVKVQGKADLFFAQVLLGKPSINISRSATAATAELAAFSIGSRLASLQGGLANQILSGLTGSTVSLSVMDYNALASANVDLLSYSQALRTTLNLKAATFDQTLSTNVSTGAALSVLANVLNSAGNTQAGAAAQKLATAAGAGNSINLGNLLDLGPYGDQDHVAGASGTSIQVGALDLSQAVLTLAQGGRQVQLNLGATIPGLTSVTAWLAIGQRPSNSPWLTVGDDGSVTIRTAQTRLYLEATALSGLGILGLQPLKLPLYVELASAAAKLSSVECPVTVANQAATLSVQPSVGQLAVGTVDTTKLNDFTTPITPTTATIVNLALVQVTGLANVKLGGASWQQVRFTRADIQAGTVKTVSTNDIVQATVESLLGNLNLNVQVLGLGLGVGPITSAVAGTLSTMAAPLDGVIDGLTGLLGLHLGEADVRVNGLRCRQAALVA